MSDFEVFLKDFFEAIKNEDLEFIKKVYGSWLLNSGVVPKGGEDIFYNAVFGELRTLPGASLVKAESFDDFTIAHLKDSSGKFSLTFRKSGDSWIFFNERTNFALFRFVYTLSYKVEGGKLRLLFNGKRSPIVYEIDSGSSGVISPINSALNPGMNEITMRSSDRPVDVSIKINSTKLGEIADSSNSNTLDWHGKVDAETTVKFESN